MICADPDCKVVLKQFEMSGGNDLCFGHRMQKINEAKKKKRREKSKFMSDEERKTYLTPEEIEEFYGSDTKIEGDKYWSW